MWESLDRDYAKEHLCGITEKDLKCDICAEPLDVKCYIKTRLFPCSFFENICINCYDGDKLTNLPIFGNRRENDIAKRENDTKGKKIVNTTPSRKKTKKYEGPSVYYLPQYNCIVCNKRITTDAWWYYSGKVINFCDGCYPQFPGELQYYEDGKNNAICIDNGACVIDITPVNNRIIPPNFKVTKESIDRWAYYVLELSELEGNFGSVRGWAAFTDEYDVPEQDLITFLMVNCSPKNNGMIASVLVDDHGRVGANILFKNVDEYLEAYNAWEAEKLSEEDRFKLIQKLEDEERYVDCCNYPLICAERMKKKKM
jgi:hypothetical protein